MENNKCWQRYGETGTFMYCWWECKMVKLLWKQLAIPPKVKHRIIIRLGNTPGRYIPPKN